MRHAFCLCVEGGMESRVAFPDENVGGKTAFEMLWGQNIPEVDEKKEF